MDDPRTYHPVEVDGVTLSSCDWCSFVQAEQPDGFPNHAAWCDADAAPTASVEMARAGASQLPGMEGP